VVVPVVVVGGVAVPVVDVVDVIMVGDGDVAATVDMGVIVSDLFGVVFGSALVEVSVVSGVEVAVVDVVDVTPVRDGDMTTAVTVPVSVAGVFGMGGGHGCSSCECRMASLTM
jgi:hypothetical protein